MAEAQLRDQLPQWTLADRLRKSLEHAHVEPIEMAQYLEVHPNTIRNWIAGRTSPPATAVKLWAMRCGVPYDWVARGLERPVPDDFGPPADYTLTNVDKPSGLHATADEPISTEEIMRFRKRIPPKPQPVDVIDSRMAAVS